MLRGNPVTAPQRGAQERRRAKDRRKVREEEATKQARGRVADDFYPAD